MTALADWVETHGYAISKRVIDDMYVDPFWRERFGGDGEKHAQNDGSFHIKHLIEALRGNSDHVMRKYATWLRGLLVTRGMSTRHIVENFERLAAAFERERAIDTEAAVGMLHVATQALTFTNDVARDLSWREDELGKRLIELCGAPVSADTEHDAKSLLGFVADEVESPGVSSLESYVTYRLERARPRGLWAAVPAGTIREALAALSNELATDAVTEAVNRRWS